LVTRVRLDVLLFPSNARELLAQAIEVFELLRLVLLEPGDLRFQVGDTAVAFADLLLEPVELDL
jgi:hypothetical protein